MKTSTPLPLLALWLVCSAPLAWAQGAAGSSPAPQGGDAARRATEACEKSVADTVRTIRDQRQIEVQFIGGQRSISPTQADETAIKGEGRYRAPGSRLTPFTYTCTFNAKSGETSGVMFKEKGVAPPQAAEPAWQPNLDKISPEVCDAAVATALKRKHPRAERVTLDSSSRQLAPGAEGRVHLRGQGALVRAPGMYAAFSARRQLARAGVEGDPFCAWVFALERCGHGGVTDFG
jgi:hypothetical protein